MSRVRQFSVLFVKMDGKTARDKANGCLESISTIDEIRALPIDEVKQKILKERDVGVRMFFHCKESKNEDWRKNVVNEISKNNLDIQIGYAKKKGENNDAGEQQTRRPLKIWNDKKYDQFKDTMLIFRRSHPKEDEKSGIDVDPASSYPGSILDEHGHVRCDFCAFLSSYTFMCTICCNFLRQLFLVLFLPSM